MKIFTPILALAVLAAAQFNYDDWRAPAADDLRSPCPVLNALANHGFLPRDGRNSKFCLRASSNVELHSAVRLLTCGNAASRVSTTAHLLTRYSI